MLPYWARYYFYVHELLRYILGRLLLGLVRHYQVNDLTAWSKIYNKAASPHFRVIFAVGIEHYFHGVALRISASASSTANPLACPAFHKEYASGFLEPYYVEVSQRRATGRSQQSFGQQLSFFN